MNKQRKLNKLVLYVSIFAVALFVFAYRVGEVKAEIFYLTEEEIELYYPLDGSCDSAFSKGDNLTLRDAGGDYAVSWVSNIFGGGLNVKGEGSSNTSKTSGCYGNTGVSLPTGIGDEFTYIFNIYNPTQPSVASAPFYLYDVRAYFLIYADGHIKFVWEHSTGTSYYATDLGVIEFGSNDSYQIVFRGTWSDNYSIGGDKQIIVNGVDENFSSDGDVETTFPVNNILDNIYIGAEKGDTYSYNGDIGEVIVLNTKIHDDDLAQLQGASLSSFLGGGGSASVFWAGVGQQAPTSPNNYNVPLYYNFCDIYQEAREVRLSLCLNTSPENDCYDEGFPYKMLKFGIGPHQCSGLTYLSGNIHWPNNPSGQSLTPALTVDWYDNSPMTVYKGGQFSYVLYGDISSNYLLANVSGSISLPLTGTSTPIGFVYNLESYDWEHEDSYICTYNLESQSIISEQCVSLTSASGLGSISLPTPPLDFDQPLAFVYVENNTQIRLMSNAFTVIWGQGRAIWEDLLGLNEDDQEGINAFYNLLKKWWARLKNIFPFNFPNAIITAWQNSETAPLTPDLAFLNVANENGDIKASFPKEWLGTSTNMEIDIFGESMIANGSQSAVDFFANFRKFTKWLQYFAFAFGVFYLVKRVISDLTEKENDNL